MLVDAVGTVWHIVRISSQITRSQPLFKAVVIAPFYRQGIFGQVSGLAIRAEAEQPNGLAVSTTSHKTPGSSARSSGHAVVVDRGIL